MPIDPTPSTVGDYIDAPFAAPWGTWEWVDDAKARYDRAASDFARAAAILLESSCQTEWLFSLRADLERATDRLLRAKWLQREVCKTIERLPPRGLQVVVDPELARALGERK